MANNTGGEYWPFLGPRGLFQQLEAEVPVSAMDSTDSTEQFLLQNTKSSPSMPKDMWWDIKYYLIHPPVIIFVMTSLNAALKQSDQRYEGSVHLFQPALGPTYTSPPFLNNWQHTSCTLALVLPRAAHLWARAGPVLVWTSGSSIPALQTLRAKLYKSPSISTARAYGTVFNFPC